MTDLKTRLGRLVDEATQRSVVPDPEVIVRRGRRRRGRRVARTVLMAAALVAAVLLLPGGMLDLPGRLGWTPDRAPAAGAEGDAPIGYAGYWYGKIDASVYLSPSGSPGVTTSVTTSPPPATDQQREAIRDKLESLSVVDEVFLETSADAYAHFREQFKDRPELVDSVAPGALPETLRVRLDDPASYAVLEQEICPGLRTREVSPCIPGVDVVTDQNEALRSLLGDYWPGRTDVSVFLTMDVSAAQRQALQDRLEAVELVDEVSYESPDAATRHLSEETRQWLEPGGTVTLPSSFRVGLHRPVTDETVEAFLDAFCDSRRTGDCAPGVAMVMGHPRR